MDCLKLPLLLGSVRLGRRSEGVARYLLSKLETDPRFQPQLLDLAAYQFPVLEERPHEMPVMPPAVEAFSRPLREADAVLIVSPEYKGGIPGALKNAIDLLEPQIWRRKAVGLCTVSAGGFGGLQCLLQLRWTALALGGVPIPPNLAISRVHEQFDEQGGLREGAKVPDVEPFLDELYFYGHALKQARQGKGK